MPRKRTDVFVNNQMFDLMLNQAKLDPKDFCDLCNGTPSPRTITNLGKKFDGREIEALEQKLRPVVETQGGTWRSILQSPNESHPSDSEDRAEGRFLVGTDQVTEHKKKLLSQMQQKLISLVGPHNPKAPHLIHLIADRLAEKKGSLDFEWFLVFDPKRHQKHEIVKGASTLLNIFRDKNVSELVDLRVVECSASRLCFDIMICDSKHVALSMLQATDDSPAFAMGFTNSQLANRLKTWCKRQVETIAVPFAKWSEMNRRENGK